MKLTKIIWKGFWKEVYLEVFKMLGLNTQKILKVLDFIIFSIVVIALATVVHLFLPADIKRVYYLLITYFMIGIARVYYTKIKKRLIKNVS